MFLPQALKADPKTSLRALNHPEHRRALTETTKLPTMTYNAQQHNQINLQKAEKQ